MKFQLVLMWDNVKKWLFMVRINVKELIFAGVINNFALWINC